MVGRGVLADDAQALQLGLQQHLAVARCATEDRGVVTEQRTGVAGARRGLVEDRHHIGRLHRAQWHGGHQDPAVVIDDVEDLDRRFVGQRPVRGIGLPQLVG